MKCRVPVCSDEYIKIADKSRGELFDITYCPMPCSFIKFYNNCSRKTFCFLQVKGDDLMVIPMEGVGTIFVPIFSSDIIQIKKEVEAFPFSSLVADCGGVLGLFVGFNFLMVWDWILRLSLYLYLSLAKKITGQ